MSVLKFGHDQDPAKDFLEEVRQIEDVYVKIAMRSRNPLQDYRTILQERITRAMGFRVGGVLECIEAKNTLRHIEILGQLGVCAHGISPSGLVDAMMNIVGLNTIRNDIIVSVGGNLHPSVDDEIKKKTSDFVAEEAKKYATGGLCGKGEAVTIGIDLAAPGSDQTVISMWVPADYHRAREKELLEANNRYLERARKAEARVKELEGMSGRAISRMIDQRFNQWLAMLARPASPRR